MYILNFIDEIGKFISPVRNFIVSHYDNPLFWLALIGFIMGVAMLAYSSLHRGE